MNRLAAILLLAGCSTVPAASSPVTGNWGGTHIGLHLGATGGTIEYDCASGTIEPVVTGSDGNFAGVGTHTPGHGGPVREGEVMPTYPVTFAGRVSGDRMTLVGKVSNGVELGPFTLRRGAEPGIFRCL